MSVILPDSITSGKDCQLETDCNLYPFLLPLDRFELLKALCILLHACQDSGFPPAAVILRITDDAQIAKYNKNYLGCAGPTNILSFPGDDTMPGSLILSAESCAREAFIYGQPDLDYLFFLLAHGFGHLAGFDHGAEMDVFCDKLRNFLFSKWGIL